MGREPFPSGPAPLALSARKSGGINKGGRLTWAFRESCWQELQRQRITRLQEEASD